MRHDIQEEVNQKTVALVFQASKLTADTLQKVMKSYLNKKRHRMPSHGKISVKKLIGQGQGAKSIVITDENIKSFSHVARKYNVDFSVKRDRTTQPPKYLVFFKGKDADVITQALKEFINVNEKKKQRVSVRAKLTQFAKEMSQDKNMELSREKNKDRGQSL